MSFVSPLLLWALPLAALPILIHLINRSRHRTIPWGAMMFLLEAKRLTRGMARLRYWLIMTMRVLAVAAIIFVIARPLMSGWLGVALGGRADTTIIVLDRSPSMEQQDVQTGESKRSTALAKLANLMATVGGRTRVVLIENTENRAIDVESAEALLDQAATIPTSTSADLPAMLETALEYIDANQTGRADVWVCSDLRVGDWRVDDARWDAVRAGFRPKEGVQLYLLSYPDVAPDNVSISVANVRRRIVGRDAELVLDVQLRRDPDATKPLEIPLEFVIDGARSVLPVEMRGGEFALQGHTIPIDESATHGWGRVELPNDENPQDNVAYFAFAEPPVHHTVIVTGDAQAAAAIKLAATSPVDPSLVYTAEVLTADRTHEIDWTAASLLVWHAPLPTDVVAQQLENFVARGRPIVFFPPDQTGKNELFGARWGSWRQGNGRKPLGAEIMNRDSDLVSDTLAGERLPIGELRTFRYCSLEGGGSVLARFAGREPLLTRASTTDGPVYFCTTLPRASHSTMARDGVLFYVMLQRALSAGAATQGDARQLVAGSSVAKAGEDWRRVSGEPKGMLSSASPFHAGAFEHEQRIIALNRPPSEDSVATLDEIAIEKLFGGLSYTLVSDRVGNTSALANDVWRAFLYAMAIALLAEALLCMPERRAPVTNEPTAVDAA